MTNLYQCSDCGHGGWTYHELTNGQCPSCYEMSEENDDHNEDECMCIDTQMDNEGWLVCNECGCVVG